MHQLVNPTKALRTMRKTPVILTAILANTSQEQAQQLRDGTDGWSILEIICHLYDIEQLYIGRIHALLSAPNPTFVVISNEELMQRGAYHAQDMATKLAAYVALRQQFIALLEPLSDEQWRLAGIHPTQGPAALLDVAINTGLHDIDHIEQITRCLASSD